MQAVLIVESCFGNTAAVADAIAEGLRSSGAEVDMAPVAEAPTQVSADLVVIAAPTHNAGMSKPKTRQQATKKGAPSSPPIGVREWIEQLDAIDGRVVTVSTTTGGKWAGSAGASIVKAFRRRKITVEHGEDFLVTDTPGPLAEGELDRAREWARMLTV